MDLKLLGLNIKNYRKSADLTQAKLAEKTNLSTVHISHIESGLVKMSVETLVKICNVLKATPNDLLWGQFDADSNNCEDIPGGMLMENAQYGHGGGAQLGEKVKKMSSDNKSIILEIADILVKHSEKNGK